MNPLKDVPEADVVADVKLVITQLHLEVQRINTGCFSIGTGRNRRFIRTAKSGTLDFEGYDNYGRFLGIECKRPVGGRLSDEQKRRIDDINSKGGVAFVVHSAAEAYEQLKINNCF